MSQGPEQSETVTIPSPALTRTSVDPNRAGDITAIGWLSTSIPHDLRNPASAICAAALAHLPNREETIFTLDRRCFGVLRLARGRNLRLIP